MQFETSGRHSKSNDIQSFDTRYSEMCLMNISTQQKFSIRKKREQKKKKMKENYMPDRSSREIDSKKIQRR